MAIINFNAANISPQLSFEPIPPSWYTVQIDASELVPTKKADGHILKLKLKVLEGEFANRILFCNLNVDNPNSKAVDIAQAQLSAICHSTGVINCVDSQELHQKPFMVRVVIRPAKGNFDASNDCRDFKAVANGGGMQQPQGMVQPNQTMQQPVQQQPVQQQQPAQGYPVQQQQQQAQQPAQQQPAPQAQQPIQQQPAQTGGTANPPWTA